MKLGDILTIIIFICVAIVLAPVILPLLAFLYLKEKFEQIRFRRYLTASEGAMFFAYTTRQTSQKYVEQNIISILPKGVQILYRSDNGRMNMGEDSKFHDSLAYAMKATPGGFPYISKVVEGRLVTESINKRLYSAIRRGAGPEHIAARIRKFFSHPTDPERLP